MAKIKVTSVGKKAGTRDTYVLLYTMVYALFCKYTHRIFKNFTYILLTIWLVFSDFELRTCVLPISTTIKSYRGPAGSPQVKSELRLWIPQNHHPLVFRDARIWRTQSIAIPWAYGSDLASLPPSSLASLNGKLKSSGRTMSSTWLRIHSCRAMNIFQINQTFLFQKELKSAKWWRFQLPCPDLLLHRAAHGAAVQRLMLLTCLLRN